MQVGYPARCKQYETLSRMELMMIASSRTARQGQLAGSSEGAFVQRPPALATMALPIPALASPQGGGISLGQRLRDWKTLVGFGVSAAIVVFFALTAHLDLGAVWINIRSADISYLVLAQIVYLGAFLFRGLRWRLLLRHAALGHEVHLPSLRGLTEMIFLSWFVNCIVPAKLGDGYRAYLLGKHTGADMGRTLGTVVGERMADILALAALLLLSGLMIAGSMAGAGLDLGTVLVWGAVLAALIGAGATGLRVSHARLVGLLPPRWRPTFLRFAEGVLRTFRRDVQLPLYGLTCLVWGCEALRIWLVMQAVHISGLAPGVIVFTALAGSLLSTIPFTPAGLGAVEGASMAILTAFGVAAGPAGAVAVLDRVINYWSNIPVGALLYMRGLRSDDRR
jgi:uncharacterized protein (TIRG00374 family)